MLALNGIIEKHLYRKRFFKYLFLGSGGGISWSYRQNQKKYNNLLSMYTQEANLKEAVHPSGGQITIFLCVGGTVCSNGFYADISNQHQFATI